jgi:predicted dithiol-disulfide oxidoreductase (DUF899 family)
MSLPEIVTREVWEQQRRELLVREKELTRARDVLNADRRRLPMVLVDKLYEFDGPSGRTDLAGLFEGRRQLIIMHTMFDPDWDDVCPSCTSNIDEMAPAIIAHMAVRDTTFALVSRAPLAKLQASAARKGWSIPWYSSYGSDFNYDFHVTMDESVTPAVYNYRTSAEWKVRLGNEHGLVEPGASEEKPGYSCFLRDGDQVFHTYSTFNRGIDYMGAVGFLDLTAMGRQEEWEEPKGRADWARPAMPNFEQ